MADKNRPLTARCIIGVACPEHGFIHGGEAEELREKLEKLEEDLAGPSLSDCDGEERGRQAAAAEIRKLLDDVDARDSLGYLGVADAEEQEFYILSLVNTQPEVLLWWKPDCRGYTTFLERAGRYSQAEVDSSEDRLDNGETTLAVPCEEAERLAHLTVREDELPALKGRFSRGVPTP